MLSTVRTLQQMNKATDSYLLVNTWCSK